MLILVSFREIFGRIKNISAIFGKSFSSKRMCPWLIANFVGYQAAYSSFFRRFRPVAWRRGCVGWFLQNHTIVVVVVTIILGLEVRVASDVDWGTAAVVLAVTNHQMCSFCMGHRSRWVIRWLETIFLLLRLWEAYAWLPCHPLHTALDHANVSNLMRW